MVYYPSYWVLPYGCYLPYRGSRSWFCLDSTATATGWLLLRLRLRSATVLVLATHGLRTRYSSYGSLVRGSHARLRCARAVAVLTAVLPLDTVLPIQFVALPAVRCLQFGCGYHLHLPRGYVTRSTLRLVTLPVPVALPLPAFAGYVRSTVTPLVIRSFVHSRCCSLDSSYLPVLAAACVVADSAGYVVVTAVTVATLPVHRFYAFLPFTVLVHPVGYRLHTLRVYHAHRVYRCGCHARCRSVPHAFTTTRVTRLVVHVPFGLPAWFTVTVTATIHCSYVWIRFLQVIHGYALHVVHTYYTVYLPSRTLHLPRFSTFTFCLRYRRAALRTRTPAVGHRLFAVTVPHTHVPLIRVHACRLHIHTFLHFAGCGSHARTCCVPVGCGWLRLRYGCCLLVLPFTGWILTRTAYVRGLRVYAILPRFTATILRLRFTVAVAVLCTLPTHVRYGYCVPDAVCTTLYTRLPLHAFTRSGSSRFTRVAVCGYAHAVLRLFTVRLPHMRLRLRVYLALQRAVWVRSLCVYALPHAVTVTRTRLRALPLPPHVLRCLTIITRLDYCIHLPFGYTCLVSYHTTATYLTYLRLPRFGLHYIPF